jgi:hypothetical protein
MKFIKNYLKKAVAYKSHKQFHDLIQQSNYREEWEGREATHDEKMNGRGKQERMLFQKKLLHTKR